MAAATKWQLALSEAMIPAAEVLKPLGFRKSGNYFNREAEDGLVQVVGFQSGQAVSIFHGTYTVNLGIYIPCVAQLEGNFSRGRYVTDAHCEVRSRLGEIAAPGRDIWWPLDDSASASGRTVANALLSHGIPFLESYRSNSAIIDRFECDGELPFHNAARSALSVAIVLWHTGNSKRSIEYFERARTVPSNNRRFPEYVTEIQKRCGLL